MPKPRKLPKHIREKFKAFENHAQNGQKQISDVIPDCLVLIQEEIPEIEDADKIVPAIVISALCSVGAWPNGEKLDDVLRRDEVLKKGFKRFMSCANADLGTPLTETWALAEQSGKKGKKCRWRSSIQSTGIEKNKNLDLVKPRDGPEEVWSVSSVGFQSRRRAVLSYVHDKQAEKDVVWQGDRRSVRLSVGEAEKIKTPTFFDTHSAAGLNDIWHDGMRYPSPDGQWNSYAGVIPYLLPGSAIWHSIPRLRSGGTASSYPSTGEPETYDKVIQSFIKIRSGAEPVHGFGKLDIEHPKDRPYRDLSGVRRLWVMAEAVCGMLRDDLIISVEDMAGLALTLMHYDCIVKDLLATTENASETSDDIPRHTLLCCIPRTTPITWSKLCSYGEGAQGVMQQTLQNAGFDEDDEKLFRYAVYTFIAKVKLLKFWYALLLATGDVRNLVGLRFEVLEDLAVAPAWEKEDRAKVYFMLEAAVINRLERRIPYEESLRRFMRAGPNGGALLLKAVNERMSATYIEMTRAQMEEMFINSFLALWRNTAWEWNDSVLSASWIAGQPGLRYVGRFTGSASKQLYIDAAMAWTECSEHEITAMATAGKQRLAVLVTPQNNLRRYLDSEENTGMEIIVASVFFLNEDEHNMALSCFGRNHFHVTKKLFRGETAFTDASGNTVDYVNKQYGLCVVDESGTYFKLSPTSRRVYQIIVTHEQGVKHARLVGIRQTESGVVNGTEPVAANGTEPVAASPLDVLDYVNGVNGHSNESLFVRRLDQISPDGRSIVDYSFEYETISVNGDGDVMSTSSVGGESAQALLLRIVRSLREKDWLG